MPQATKAKKASPTAAATKSKPAKIPLVGSLLSEIAKSGPSSSVSFGGLNPDAILNDNPEKIARATHNQERHKSLNGKTVREALATRLVDARDIRYDLAKGFMTI